MIEYIFEIWWVNKDSVTAAYYSYYDLDIVTAANGVAGLAAAREVIHGLNKKSAHYTHQIRNFRPLDC